MTTAVVVDLTERPSPRIIGTIAGKEISDALHSRWFWLWTIAFTALASFMAAVALPGSQVAGFGSFGRTAASLVAILPAQRDRQCPRRKIEHIPGSTAEDFAWTYVAYSLRLQEAQ